MYPVWKHGLVGVRLRHLDKQLTNVPVAFFMRIFLYILSFRYCNSKFSVRTKTISLGILFTHGFNETEHPVSEASSSVHRADGRVTMISLLRSCFFKFDDGFLGGIPEEQSQGSLCMH
jgi:hypothetical protein